MRYIALILFVFFSITTYAQQGAFNNKCEEVVVFENVDYVQYSSDNVVPSAAPSDGVDTYVLDNGDRYEWDGTTWQKVEIQVCQIETTRAAVIALRNAGSLEKDCHYVINNPNANGTLLLDKVLVHAVDESTLSGCYLKTSHDNIAWNGWYDIDRDDVLRVVDNLENEVTGNTAIQTFPFGVTTVFDNTVEGEAILTYVSGTVDGNTFGNNSNTTVNSGVFTDNVISSDANVVSSASFFVQNQLEASSNTTINSGDFRENRVESDATVTSNTTGDVDNNHFSSLSISNISGDANVDANSVKQNANLTVSGGSLSDSSIQEDAQVTIISESNYENIFGASTIYTQVGTGYIRYSTIEGTSSWINGDVNISNVESYTSTINTTGSTGTISNSKFNRALGNSMQNVADLTVTDCTVSNYGQFIITGAARLYLYRSTVTDGSRILVSAGSRIDASYTDLDSYSYLQSTGSGGELYANYCNLSSLGYIRNLTTNIHRAERCNVSSQGSIRFDGTAKDCRVYYSQVSSGGAIYHAGTSDASYIYYSNASSLAQVYTSNSVNARIYYCSADSRGHVRSLDNAATHYMYYCKSDASSFVQMNSSGGRMYSVSASSQSIIEKRGLAGNLYYSSADAYFYAYITRDAGTSTGLFGMGRRTQTVTDPVGLTPYSVGSAWLNF